MSRRTYVDNAYNRRIGRVGMPVGSHVVSRSSGGSSSYGGGSASYCSGGYSSSSSGGGQRCYVDNEYNRKLGRVGKPVGTHVVSRSGEVTITKSAGESGQRCYVDNPYNRKLGRVGMPLGSCVVSTSGACAAPTSGSACRSGGQRCYVDNAYNRMLGRVGKPLGSHVVSKRGSVQKLVTEHTLQDLIDALHGLGLADARRPQYECAMYVLERKRVEGIWRDDGIVPSTDVSRLIDHTSGEIIPYSELKMDKKPIGKGGFGEVFAGRWHGIPIASRSCCTSTFRENSTIISRKRCVFWPRSITLTP